MKELGSRKFYFKIVGIAAATALSITGYMVVEGQSYKSVDSIDSEPNILVSQRSESPSPPRNTEPKQLMV